MTFTAATHDLRWPVTIASGLPYRFIDFHENLAKIPLLA